MRMLLRVTFPVEAGNAAIKDGRMAKMLEMTMGKLKPEAAYFCPEDGQRQALLVFDMKDPSEIPVIAEPLYQELHASVQFFPVMNIDDLTAGLQKLAKSS